MKCQLYNFLYNLIPFKKIKIFIIQKHVSSCKRCRDELPSDSELSVLFAAPSWIHEEKNMWPEIKHKLNKDTKTIQSKPKKANLFFPAWGWAAAVLFIIIAAGILYLASLNPSRDKISSAASSPGAIVKVKYGEIKGEKARYHLYQADNKYYILFLKSQNIGG